MGLRVSSLEICRCCSSAYASLSARWHWLPPSHARRCTTAGYGITYLLLGVGPAGDLDDHVQNGLLLVGVERDIVERRDGHAILLDVDAVLESVRSTDFAGGEDARGVGESLGHGCCDSGILGRMLDGGGREVTLQLRGTKGGRLGWNFVGVGRAGGAWRGR